MKKLLILLFFAGILIVGCGGDDEIRYRSDRHYRPSPSYHYSRPPVRVYPPIHKPIYRPPVKVYPPIHKPVYRPPVRVHPPVRKPTHSPRYTPRYTPPRTYGIQNRHSGSTKNHNIKGNSGVPIIRHRTKSGTTLKSRK